MDKTLIKLITKMVVFGILVLIFIVLFNIIREPYSIQTGGFESQEEVKSALRKTRKIGDELDNNLLERYVDRLKAPGTKVPVTQRNNYYVPLPKEFSVVGYENVSQHESKPVKHKKK